MSYVAFSATLFHLCLQTLSQFFSGAPAQQQYNAHTFIGRELHCISVDLTFANLFILSPASSEAVDCVP